MLSIRSRKASRSLLISARHKLVDVQSRNEEMSRRVQRNDAILKKLAAINELFDAKEKRECFPLALERHQGRY
uniref:Lebercilin domain-containing protein n=1 Tax=Steinernema glaseri TaxID=37863 RepID=A0A1I8AMZ7_9BILA